MKQKRGFTLIELLIVIVIIGILAAIVVGLVGTTAQKKARDVKKKASAHEIQNGLELYFSDEEAYPATDGLAAAIAPTYIKSMPTDMTGLTYTQTDAGACYTIDIDLEAADDEQLTCKQ